MGMWPQLSIELSDATSPWLSLECPRVSQSVPECPRVSQKISLFQLTPSWQGSSLLPARFGNVLMLLSLPSSPP